MNADDLKNIRKLRHEVTGLEMLIKDISGEVVKDVVTGSSPNFPYGKHKIVIRGADNKRIHSTRIRLIKKRNKLRRAIEEVENYLETVTDPEMRNILRLRYEKGMSWMEVARVCGSTEKAVQKRAERFLKNL